MVGATLHRRARMRTARGGRAAPQCLHPVATRCLLAPAGARGGAGRRRGTDAHGHSARPGGGVRACPACVRV